MANAPRQGPSDPQRARLDVALSERGLAPTRAKAQALVREGRVRANGTVITKSATLVGAETRLDVTPGRDFVSRGGRKLDGALDDLGISLDGKIVVDVGASTGGFTDSALRRGAGRVYAVDVGHGQLDPELRKDPRVVVRDGTNARSLTAKDFPEPIDVVVVDASFISLDKLAGAFARVLRPGGWLVALVKPEFEAGRAAVRRTRGVVRDGSVRARAIRSAVASIAAAGFSILGECDSRVAGKKGNVEHFVWAERH